MEDLESFKYIGTSKYARLITKVLIGLVFAVIILLFLPWTQNIDGLGNVTTLLAEERPQEVNTVIDGKIEAWFVNEGERVNKGDTLLKISEIKDYYFDPLLVQRTKSQAQIKSSSVVAYEQKVTALSSLVETLKRNQKIKYNQALQKLNSYQLKLTNDSASYIATQQAYGVAKKQYDRAIKMKDEGIIALYELENRQVKFQEIQAKYISSQNKLQEDVNNIAIATNELNNVNNTYNEKIAKASSDLYSAEIALLTAQADLVKIENSLANIETRVENYYIKAPQSGFISETVNSGVGEIVKAGKKVVVIVPKDQKLAAEVFVKPIDIPLLEKGQEVRLVFDGWPSIVFAGWPGASVGTFSASVYSIDRRISKNGKYRVLVTQRADQPWPKELQVGSGLHAYALLNDVPVWYEVWRQLNGFPADYYKQEAKNNEKK
ncbi:MAG: HlyD family efflux transporter periplasmic adaptor subunit [Flavobacteriales bacterium]|nr:HlyD family efflux transporter periplasmic adaptor subunit [Flavobacteriales bacterium]